MTLPQTLLADVIIMLAAISTLIILSVYLFVRLRKSVTVNVLQAVTAAFLLAFIMRFMDKTRLVPVGENIYHRLSLFAFFVAFILTAILISLVVFGKLRGHRELYLPPDLSELFAELDDLVLIYNRNFCLVGVNKPELLNTICPNSEYSLGGLLDLLDIKSNLDLQKHDIDNQNSKFDKLEGCSHKSIESKEDTGKISDIGGRKFLIRTSPVSDRIRMDLGLIVILHDITREQELVDKIGGSNKKLEKTCDELEKRIGIEQELEFERYRMLLLQEVQNEISNQLEQIMNYLEKEQTDYANLADELRAAYKQVRQTVHSMYKRQR